MIDSLIILQENPEQLQQDLPETDVITKEKEDEKSPWRVMLFDDDIHTFEEVIKQLVKALNCDTSHAEELTLKVHKEGKAKVYEGDFEACLEINGVLEEIQLITEIKG
jgi:ATP-dependent Clp protease adapter protein ClpS